MLISSKLFRLLFFRFPTKTCTCHVFLIYYISCFFTNLIVYHVDTLFIIFPTHLSLMSYMTSSIAEFYVKSLIDERMWNTRDKTKPKNLCSVTQVRRGPFWSRNRSSMVGGRHLNGLSRGKALHYPYPSQLGSCPKYERPVSDPCKTLYNLLYII